MGKFIENLGMQAGSAAAGGIMGMILGGYNDERQLRQQEKLQNLQIWGQQQMTDYNMKKQLEMWEKTNYHAQVEQLKKAGLNPGLLYGMGGAGGATTGGASGSVQGGSAPSGGREVQDMLGMGMQLQLLKAQKENIEADTANKEAQTRDTTASAETKGLENAFIAWMQGTTPEGEDIGDDISKSSRGQQMISDIKKNYADTKFKLNEDERQALMNSKVMEEIGAKISLMAKQGQKEEEIYKNLVKEGLLLDAEIEWNKLDIESGNVGKFITNVIRLWLKK